MWGWYFTEPHDDDWWCAVILRYRYYYIMWPHILYIIIMIIYILYPHRIRIRIYNIIIIYYYLLWQVRTLAGGATRTAAATRNSWNFYVRARILGLGSCKWGILMTIHHHPSSSIHVIHQVDFGETYTRVVEIRIFCSAVFIEPPAYFCSIQ